MSKTLREIAALVGGTIVGEADTLVAGASGLEDAAQGDILFVENRRYADRAAASQASQLVPPVVVPNKPCITAGSRAAFWCWRTSHASAEGSRRSHQANVPWAKAWHRRLLLHRR